LLDYNFIVKESYKINNQLIQIIAYHVDSILLADGTRKLELKSESKLREAQVTLTEVFYNPKQSSKKT
jgi:hypothetical protein